MKITPWYAFTLLELLVVIAIIGLLAVFAVPAVNSMGQARGVSESGYQIAAALELARAEALARNAWVRVGMVSTNSGGQAVVRLGMVVSGDGSPGTNDLRPLTRVLTLKNVALSASAQANAVELAGLTGSPFNVGGVSFGNGPVVLFTPQGEAMTNEPPTADAGFTPLVAVGIREARGTTILTNNPVDILIEGATGLSKIIRK